jgi:hypothetical protein
MSIVHSFLGDLARGLFGSKEVLARYSLTKAEAKSLLMQAGMFDLYKQHKAAWSNDQNVNVRIRQKGLLIIELFLEELGRRLLEPGVSAGDIEKLVNALAKALNTANPPAVGSQGGITGSPFSVTINLGGHTTTVTAPRPSYGAVLDGHAEASAEPEMVPA